MASITDPNTAVRNLDTSLLRAFVAAVDRGSMTASAAALNLTQGAVSQKIARLEAQAGGALLTRTRNGLGLTPSGERLLAKARRLLALNDEIWIDLQDGGIDGPARLGAPVDLAGPVLVPMLKAFMAAFPQVQPQLLCGSSADIRTWLMQGELDLAVMEGPAADAAGECLAIERLVWVGAAGGIAHARTPLPVSLALTTCCFRPQVTAALARSGRDMQVVFENGGLDATVAAVRADMAVSAWLASTVPPGLAVLGRDTGLPEMPPYAITLHQPERTASPAVQELARHLRKGFGHSSPVRSS